MKSNNIIFDYVNYFLKYLNNLPEKILLLQNQAISHITREYLTIS